MQRKYMCNWISKEKKTCKRTSLEDSDFCLFHKPDKAIEEANLFWKIINFRAFSQRKVDLEEQLHVKASNDQQICEQLSIEIDNIHNSNFTLDEKEKPDFETFKKKVIYLYYDSNISGRSNFVNPDFDGFVFPKIGDVFDRFNYMYNPFTDGSLFFRECIYEGAISFADFHFLGQTMFEDCDFKGGVFFTNAFFIKSISFINTSIYPSTFYGMGMFQDTTFRGSKVLFNNVKGLLEFESNFSEKTDLELINMDFPTDFGRASFGENAYRLAKIQKERIGDFGNAAKYFYLEKCYKGYQILPKLYLWDKKQKGLKRIQVYNYFITRKAYKKILPKLMDLIFKYSIGYGEKPLRALRMLLLLMFAFALFYMFVDIKINSSVNIK